MKILLSFIFALACMVDAIAQNSVVFRGSGSDLINGDSVDVLVRRFNIGGVDKRLYDSYKTVIKDQTFEMAIPGINGPKQVIIRGSGHKFPSLSDYLVLPGHEIDLVFQSGKLSVQGKNSRMFAVQHDLRQVERNVKYPSRRKNTFALYIAKLDSIEQESMVLLDKSKGLLNPVEYRLLKETVEEGPVVLAVSQYDFSRKFYGTDSAFNLYYLQDLKARASRYNTKGFVSKSGLEFIRTRYELDSCESVKKDFSPTRYLKYIQQNHTGELRERLLVKFLTQAPNLSEIPTGLLLSLNREMSSPVLKKIAYETITQISDGAAAFNFALPDTSGRIIALNDLKGKVVVLDFWYTGCPGCKVTGPILEQTKIKVSGNPDIEFVSVSIDKKLSTWNESIKNGVYTSPTHNNLNAGQSAEGEKMIDQFRVFSYPTIYLIDKKGRLYNIKKDPRSDNGSDLVRQINELL